MNDLNSNWAENVHVLCNAFCAQIRKELTPEQVEEVNLRNERVGFAASVCHTHDFIDANQSMIEAYKSTFGEAPKLLNDENSNEQEVADQTSIINEAWADAKNGRFNAMPAKKVELCLHFLDETEPRYVGFETDNGRYMFSKDVAQKIVDLYNANKKNWEMEFKWIGEALELTTYFEGELHDIATYQPTDVWVDGEIIAAYAIGEGSWSWEQ